MPDQEPKNSGWKPVDNIRPHQWKPGQSGNPKGRPKNKTLTELVRGVLERELNGKVPDQLLAEVIVKHALSGKFPFVKELWDRLDGKVQDRLDVAAGPLTVRVVYDDESPPHANP
jgi:hypothetical protein